MERRPGRTGVRLRGRSCLQSRPSPGRDAGRRPGPVLPGHRPRGGCDGLMDWRRNALGLSAGIARGIHSVLSRSPAPGLPQRFVLGPPAHTVFEVRGPDGQPVAGARVEPRRLNKSRRERTGRPCVAHRGQHSHRRPRPRRDDRVHSRGDRVGSRRVRELRAAGFRFKFQELIPEPRVLSLHPAGRLKGRSSGTPMPSAAVPSEWSVSRSRTNRKRRSSSRRSRPMSTDGLTFPRPPPVVISSVPFHGPISAGTRVQGRVRSTSSQAKRPRWESP